MGKPRGGDTAHVAGAIDVTTIREGADGSRDVLQLGYASAQGTAATNSLVAVKVATASSLTAGATDPAWANAKPVSISNGTMTSVLSRKLVTGSKLDVQFSDLNGKYPFGFAAFDNAQVRHAVHFSPLYLTFSR